MTTINTSPYTLTLKPGANAHRAADQAAAYVVNRWLPNNAGGVHILITPRLAKALLSMLQEGLRYQRDVRVRVTIEGNIPHLTVLPVRARA